MLMTSSNAKRLLKKETLWGKCGTGDQGRNGGTMRAKKKARQHANRLAKLAKAAGDQ